MDFRLRGGLPEVRKCKICLLDLLRSPWLDPLGVCFEQWPQKLPTYNDLRKDKAEAGQQIAIEAWPSMGNPVVVKPQLHFLASFGFAFSVVVMGKG